MKHLIEISTIGLVTETLTSTTRLMVQRKLAFSSFVKGEMFLPQRRGWTTEVTRKDACGLYHGSKSLPVSSYESKKVHNVSFRIGLKERGQK